MVGMNQDRDGWIAGEHATRNRAAGPVFEAHEDIEMTPEPGNLLESDRIEDVLQDESAAQDETPAAPVMVVQAGSRARPWLLIGSTIAAVGLGSAYSYHRHEIERLNAEAEIARHDYLRAVEQARADENERQLKAAPPSAETPAVSDSPLTPASPPIALAVSTPPPSPPTPHPTPAAPTPTPEPKTAPKVAAGPAAPERPVEVVATVAEAAKLDSSDRPPAFAPFGDPIEGRTITRAPLDREAAPASASPLDIASEPAAASEPAVAIPAAEPLPTAEETERRIRAEAAAIGHEKAQKVEQQREALMDLRDDERRQFVEELRTILREQGRQAGPEIERLSNRSGRSDDPRLKMRARVVIMETRASQHAKVRKLRELGVPESVILDYLANAMEHNLGGRRGPRSRNEIWVRAGEMLVRYHDMDEPPRANPSAPAR